MQVKCLEQLQPQNVLNMAEQTNLGETRLHFQVEHACEFQRGITGTTGCSIYKQP